MHVPSVSVCISLYVLGISKQVTPGICEVYPNYIIDKSKPLGKKKSLWHFGFLLREWGLKNILTRKKEVRTNQ